jgi:Ca2+-binding RTX toxin-like protein
MAKAVFFDKPSPDLDQRSFSHFIQTLEPFDVVVGSTSEVTYTGHNDFTMVLGGTGFAGDGTGLTAGTIKSATFFNAEGDKLATVTGINVKAAAFDDAMEETDTSSVFMNLAFKKKDTFTASDLGDTFFAGRGDDVLKGGDGIDFLAGMKDEDTMTGGGGRDFFIFNQGDGKDVITDFDAKGGFANQDFIILGELSMLGDMKEKKSGANTLLDFGGGDTLLLKGVKPGDVDFGDFA